MTELLKCDVEIAKSEIEELSELLSQSITDEFYEQAAKDRLGMVNQGEIIFIDNYR